VPLEIWIAIFGGLFVVLLSVFTPSTKKDKSDEQDQR